MIAFNFSNAQFDYTPYPICLIPDFLSPADYASLCDSFPDSRHFALMGKHQHVKQILGERYNSTFFNDFVHSQPEWNRFYRYVKSERFVRDVLTFLADNNIDLGFPKRFWYTPRNSDSYLRTTTAALLRRPLITSKLTFSILPSNGGQVLPHTDSASKRVTMVISFIRDGEWQQQWGGGTAVNTMKDETRTYNQVNKVVAFDEVNTVKTFPFNPNQCVLFIKTYNSLHSVPPISAPDTAFRRTVHLHIKTID